MNLRINENKKLLASFSGAVLESDDEKPNQFVGNNNELNDKNSVNSLATNNMSFYALTIVDKKRRRPKSMSYMDWRGQTSRPSTAGRTRKNRQL